LLVGPYGPSSTFTTGQLQRNEEKARKKDITPTTSNEVQVPRKDIHMQGISDEKLLELLKLSPEERERFVRGTSDLTLTDEEFEEARKLVTTAYLLLERERNYRVIQPGINRDFDIGGFLRRQNRIDGSIDPKITGRRFRIGDPDLGLFAAEGDLHPVDSKGFEKSSNRELLESRVSRKLPMTSWEKNVDRGIPESDPPKPRSREFQLLEDPQDLESLKPNNWEIREGWLLPEFPRKGTVDLGLADVRMGPRIHDRVDGPSNLKIKDILRKPLKNPEVTELSEAPQEETDPSA